MKTTEILQEYTTHEHPLPVDREAGVIRGVRILGPVSGNGRRYLHEAISGAARLYEGAHVRLDHKSGPRGVLEKAGWLQSVRVVEGGLSGDFHFLTSVPETARIAEAAERHPAMFGFSHEVRAKTAHRGGEVVVEEILEVRSVDLVDKPATTSSLFEHESKEPPAMKRTVRQVAEACKSQKYGRFLALLLEEDMLPDAAEVPVEAPPEASPAEQVDAAFKAAVIAAIDDASDTADAMAKIKAILKAKDQLDAAADETPPAEEPPASDSQESLRQEVAKLTAEVTGLKESLGEAVKLSKKPRSTPARRLTESREEFPTGRDFARALTA